jgi:hypothetical protein
MRNLRVWPSEHVLPPGASKAGYTILPGGGEESKPMYVAAYLFTKGTFKGSLRVIDTGLTIQTPPDPHQ